MIAKMLPLAAAVALVAGTASAAWDAPAKSAPVEVNLDEWTLGFDTLELAGAR